MNASAMVVTPELTVKRLPQEYAQLPGRANEQNQPRHQSAGPAAVTIGSDIQRSNGGSSFRGAENAS